MLTEDYFMRMINQALYVLKKILGLKTSGHYGEALGEIEQILELLVGLKPDLIKRLDDESIYSSLTQQGVLDTDRLYLVAELLREEGEILEAIGRTEESYLSYLRALNFYVETALEGRLEHFEPPYDKVDSLYQKLASTELTIDTLYPLFCCYEEAGMYEKGERVLLRMAEDSQVQEELRKEQVDYYQRLLEKSDEELEKGGLTRAEVMGKLANVNPDSG